MISKLADLPTDGNFPSFTCLGSVETVLHNIEYLKWLEEYTDTTGMSATYIPCHGSKFKITAIRISKKCNPFVCPVLFHPILHCVYCSHTDRESLEPSTTASFSKHSNNVTHHSCFVNEAIKREEIYLRKCIRNNLPETQSICSLHVFTGLNWGNEYWMLWIYIYSIIY